MASGLKGVLLLMIGALLAYGPLARSQDRSQQELLFESAAAHHRSELNDVRAKTRNPMPWAYDIFKLNVAQFAQMLKFNYEPGTGVLFYSHVQGKLSVWLIDSQGLQGFHVASVSAENLQARVNALRGAMQVDQLQLSRAPRLRGATPAKLPAAVQPLNVAVKQLTDMLLPEPVARPLSRIKQLIVVPALGIGSAPFGMLRPMAGDAMLIDHMSVSLAPSLYDVLTIHGEKDSGRFENPLVVGISTFSPDTEYDFPPLPGAENEAREVAKILGTEAVGQVASKSFVTRKATEADILYFATHAVGSQNLEGSNDGFLVVCSGAGPECRWSGKEIHDQRYKARLAVLSACQTGVGKVHNGGIVNIARSFQIGGVEQVVMSLWSIDDNATSAFMQAFTAKLSDTTPADALRQTMIEMKRKGQKPSQWAAFVHFGTPR